MTAVSASSLFHFTSRREHLIDILTNEFRAHYSLEDISGVAAPTKLAMASAVAFPLVSFCDIPLSQTIEHMRTYGEYAIGLTKSWALSKSLTPVMYYHPQSGTTEALRRVGNDLRGQTSTQFVPRKGPNPLAAFVPFIKPYEGELIRRGVPSKRVRFYDEREWRFVPQEALGAPVMTKEDWLDESKVREANQTSRSFAPLSFDPEDIRYIIVAKEEDRLEIVRDIARIKSRHTYESVTVLTSRILSAEQIREDF